MKQVAELIRGEMAAVQSIDAVLKKLKDVGETQELTNLRSDHVKAVDLLKRYAGTEIRGEIDTSGPWGKFASAFTGGASLFGDKAAISALKVGEQYGVSEYREALQDNAINPDLRRVIETELLPQQERHLALINKYLH